MGCSASSSADSELTIEVSRTPTPFKEPPPRKLYQLKEVNEGPITEEEGSPAKQVEDYEFPLLNGVISNATANSSQVKLDSRPTSVKSLKSEDRNSKKSPCIRSDSALSISRPSSVRSVGISNDRTASLKSFRSRSKSLTSKESIRSIHSASSQNFKEKVHVLLVESDQVTDDNKDCCSDSSLGYSTGTYTITKENCSSPTISNKSMNDSDGTPDNTALGKLGLTNSFDNQQSKKESKEVYNNKTYSSKLDESNDVQKLDYTDSKNDNGVESDKQILTVQSKEIYDGFINSELDGIAKEAHQSSDAIKEGIVESAVGQDSEINNQSSIIFENAIDFSQTNEDDDNLDSISNRKVFSADVSISDLLDDTDSFEDLPCSLAASSSGLVIPRPATSRKKKDSSGSSSSVRSQYSHPMEVSNINNTSISCEHNTNEHITEMTCSNNIGSVLNDVCVDESIPDSSVSFKEIDKNVVESSSPQSWLGDECKEIAESNTNVNDNTITQSVISLQKEANESTNYNAANIISQNNQPINKADKDDLSQTVDIQELLNSENVSSDIQLDNVPNSDANLESTNVTNKSEVLAENNVNDDEDISIFKHSKSHVRFDLPEVEDKNLCDSNVPNCDASNELTNDKITSENNSSPLLKENTDYHNVSECFQLNENALSQSRLKEQVLTKFLNKEWEENEVNDLNKEESICNKPYQPSLGESAVDIFLNENGEVGEETRKAYHNENSEVGEESRQENINKNDEVEEESRQENINKNSKVGEEFRKKNIYSEKIIPAKNSIMEEIVHEEENEISIVETDSNSLKQHLEFKQPIEIIEMDSQEVIDTNIGSIPNQGGIISESDFLIPGLPNDEMNHNSNSSEINPQNDEIKVENVENKILSDGNSFNFCGTTQFNYNMECRSSFGITKNDDAEIVEVDGNILQQELKDDENLSQNKNFLFESQFEPTKDSVTIENNDTEKDIISSYTTDDEKRHDMPEVVSHENSVFDFGLENKIIENDYITEIKESESENKLNSPNDLGNENTEGSACYTENSRSEVSQEGEVLAEHPKPEVSQEGEVLAEHPNPEVSQEGEVLAEHPKPEVSQEGEVLMIIQDDNRDDILNEDDFDVIPDENCGFEFQESDDIIQYIPEENCSPDSTPCIIESNNIEGYKNMINISKNNSSKNSPKGSETASLKSLEVQHVGKFIASNSNSSLLENDTDRDSGSKPLLMGF